MREILDGRLTGQGGVPIFYRGLIPENPRAVLVIVHGVAEHSGRYIHLMNDMARRGFASFAIDQRGLGQSGGFRGHVDRFEDLTEDVASLVTVARSDFPGLPVFLVGHSMGGLVVLLTGIRYPNGLSGVVASGPALALQVHVPAWKKALARVVGALAPRFSMDNGIPCEALSHDPEVVESYRNDPMRYPKLTARFYLEFVRAMGEASALAGQMHLPILIMQGGADCVVKPEASRAFADQAGSADKRFIMYDGLFHEIFNEPEKTQIFGVIADWVEEHLAGSERNADRV